MLSKIFEKLKLYPHWFVFRPLELHKIISEGVVTVRSFLFTIVDATVKSGAAKDAMKAKAKSLLKTTVVAAVMHILYFCVCQLRCLSQKCYEYVSYQLPSKL